MIPSPNGSRPLFRGRQTISYRPSRGRGHEVRYVQGITVNTALLLPPLFSPPVLLSIALLAATYL